LLSFMVVEDGGGSESVKASHPSRGFGIWFRTAQIDSAIATRINRLGLSVRGVGNWDESLVKGMKGNSHCVDEN
jgi:hypothetical protein